MDPSGDSDAKVEGPQAIKSKLYSLSHVALNYLVPASLSSFLQS